jgi:hypothetical protein
LAPHLSNFSRDLETIFFVDELSCYFLGRTCFRVLLLFCLAVVVRNIYQPLNVSNCCQKDYAICYRIFILRCKGNNVLEHTTLRNSFLQFPLFNK